jgi:glycerophosphoryl diester phosphodiesterase
MFTSLPSPVLIAHRGASAHAPENTLAAFKLAASQGAPAIELDVQLSSDGSVVVFHDTTLSRTTNGHGKIRRHTLDQLKILHAGAAFGSAYPSARIPTLEEVFYELDPNIYLNIELKNINSPFDSLPERTASLISENKAEKRVLISSFNPVALSRMARHLPTIPRGLLLHKPAQVDLYLSLPGLISRYQTINISYACVTRFRVDSLHKAGKKVFVYTLNHPEDIQYAIESGVDGFFTDDPALGLRTLSGRGYNDG